MFPVEAPLAAKRREYIVGEGGEARTTGEGPAAGAGELLTGLETCGFALTLGKLGFVGFDVVELFLRRAIEHL